MLQDDDLPAIHLAKSMIQSRLLLQKTRKNGRNPYKKGFTAVVKYIKNNFAIPTFSFLIAPIYTKQYTSL